MIAFLVIRILLVFDLAVLADNVAHRGRFNIRYQPLGSCLTISPNVSMTKCDTFSPMQQFQAVRVLSEGMSKPVLLLMNASTKDSFHLASTIAVKRLYLLIFIKERMEQKCLTKHGQRLILDNCSIGTSRSVNHIV